MNETAIAQAIQRPRRISRLHHHCLKPLKLYKHREHHEGSADGPKQWESLYRQFTALEGGGEKKPISLIDLTKYFQKVFMFLLLIHCVNQLEAGICLGNLIIY